MSRHAYPAAAMLGDYSRAGAGVAAMAAILIAVPIGPIAGTLFGGMAALFSVFGLRTALRHRTLVEAGPEGLRATGPRPATIAWSALDGFKLAYYSTRRDHRDGWMQLDLRAGGQKLRVDSRIDGFSELVEQAVRAAQERGLTIDDASLANLQALGLSLPEMDSAPMRLSGASFETA